jgi:gliding motility-associated-like protein
MFRKITTKRLYWFIGFYIISTLFISAQSQYTVTGGSGNPVQAVNKNRIEVYFVYGMDNVQISYTSGSSSHQWYRYKTRVDFENPESVASVRNGNTSTVTNVEEGYGYYVNDRGAMNYYVWVLDYSKYENDFRSLNISTNIDECFAIRLTGDVTIPEIVYYTDAGVRTAIEKEFSVSYNTLEWNGADNFISKTVDTIIDPFNTSLQPPPLTDTYITLRGDLFARHFGVEKEISTSYYQPKAIAVYADTLTEPSPWKGSSGDSGEDLLAPATITFRAYANTPVASRFLWKIFKSDSTNTTGQADPIVSFTSETLTYTFDRHGKYTVTLEVSDRTGSCVNNEISFNISITETEMIVPNAFSPGTTPGINDIFRVSYKSVVKFQGWVINRWGNELFYWNDPSQGWDGKYRGKYVPPGAYYYIIEYVGTDGKKRVKKGDINVFRGKDSKEQSGSTVE